MREPLGLLGLARRAGKLAAGEDAVNAALQAGKVRLLMLAADAGEKTVRRMEFCSQGRIPILCLSSDKTELGAALGWAQCAVAAMTDLGMALSFARKLAETEPGHRPVAEALSEKQEKLRRRKAAKPGRRTPSGG